MLAAMEIPEFVTDGLCAQTDPEIFFPEKGHNGREAKKICARCPVRAECLAWALDRKERVGVWGGTTGHERDAMRRRRQPAPAAAA